MSMIRYNVPWVTIPSAREKVVAALMFWSDAMRLATFSTTRMWPVYMLFGNLSKYIRSKPNSGATKHLAYIPPLPDSLQDELKKVHPKWDTQQKAILTHCHWDLMHAVWRFLLDDDFIHMHTYGIVMRCHDSVEWHVYLRIFMYSADYPEKWVARFQLASVCDMWLIVFRVLLATIQDQGLCPCPCCLVPDTKLDQLGLVADMKTWIQKYCVYPTDAVKKARDTIYNFVDPVNSTTVQQLLKGTSTVPTSVSHQSIHLDHLWVKCKIVVNY